MIKKSLSLYLFVSAFICLFISFSAKAQAYQWKSLPMGAGGFVSGIITSKQEANLIYCRTDVGGAYKKDVATGNWKPLLDWAAVNQAGFMGVESIALDPQVANKVYMFVGISYFDGGKSAILTSNDYGQTFTTNEITTQFKAHGNGMGRSNGERLQVDPNLGSTLYVGTRYNGLWKSTNYGVTWNRLSALNVNTTINGNGISFVLINPASATRGNESQTIYVGVSRYTSEGDNIYKSTDGGLTFNPVAGGPAAYMPQRAVLINNSGELVINYANGSGPYGTTAEPMGNGGIYKYNTGSGTFTNITPTGIARAWGGLSVDPNNSNRIIASTINNYQLQYGSAYGDRIYFTTNGGTSWTDVVARGFTLNANGIPWITGQAIHWAGSIEFDPFDTKKVMITSGNGIFTNDNIDVAATSWKFDVNGLEELVPRDMISIPGGPLVTVVSDYDGFKHVDINQYGTRTTPTSGTTTGIAYGGSTNQILFRAGAKNYFSNNQGASWTQVTQPTTATEGKVAVSADGATILHCPNNSSITYYSKDNGATWTACTGLPVSNATPVADKVNAGKFYAYNSSGSGPVYVSTDAGVSFTATTNIGSNGSKIIRTVPGLEGHIWIAMYNGGLRRSVNSGTSFTTPGNVTACSAIGFGKAAPGATYVTLYMWGTVNGATGIFKSIDEGVNWVQVNDAAHQFGGPGNGQFVMGDMNTYDVVYMSTVGRGVVVGRADNSLPVSLLGFNVYEQKVNGKTLASLAWKTAAEYNAGFYGIERSTNALNWTMLGLVPSKAINGNSNAPLSYVYADDVSGMKGLVYYRLKIADKNGGFTYSSIGSLSIGKKEEGLSLAVLPNPAVKSQAVTLRFSSDKEQKILIKIVGANGVDLLTKYVTVSIGNTNVSMPELAKQPSGVYTVKVVSVIAREQVALQRFVLQ